MLGKAAGGHDRSRSDVKLGVRVALSGTLLGFMVLIAGMLTGHVERWIALPYWLFIGLVQWAYLVPGIAIAAWRRRGKLAKGLALGGGIVAAVNALAWVIGVYLTHARWPESKP